MVGTKYREKLITPKDFMSHFKLILHNAFYFRHKDAERVAAGTARCRLCGSAEERCMHLPRCRCLNPLWKRFISVARLHTRDDDARDRLILLGLSDPPLPKALSDFHLILWKFILIRLTLVDLENKPFIADYVWDGAVRRYLSKANVLTFRVGELARTAEASSREVDFKHLNLLIHPLGKLDPDGTIAWCDDFARHASAVDPRILPPPS